MGTIKDILKRAKNAQASFDSDLELAIKFVADDLLYLQREKQLFEGLGNDGNIIAVYSRATESMTEGIQGIGYPKRAGSPMNFYASGSLFKSFSYRFEGGSRLEIFATDAKTSELVGRYPTMIGLSPENTQEFNYKFLLNALRGAISRHFI